MEGRSVDGTGPAAQPAPAVDDPGAVERRRAALAATALLGALNVADVVITRAVLAHSGAELNPVAERLLADDAALVVKVLIVAALAWRFWRRPPRLVPLCLVWLVTGVYCAVVVMNGVQFVVVVD